MDERQFHIFYGVGLAITTIIMLLIILTGVRSLNVTFLVFFYVLKFLSGFGLILSITNLFMIILVKGKDKLGKKGAKFLILLQFIVPILLIIYAFYKIISSYLGNASSISMAGIWPEFFVILDDIIYIYGIISLLLQLYIIPILRGKFDEAINMGRNQKWGRSLRQAGRNLKKKWLKWKDQTAKAMALDQKTLKETLDLWRNKFAVILLIPFAIGALIFTPICFICIVFWLKIIIFDRTTINTYEKIALGASMLVILVIAIISPYVQLGIYSEISGYLWTIHIFYLLGIIFATFIFTKKLLNLQGITLRGMILDRKNRKIAKLKQKTKELKQEAKKGPVKEDPGLKKRQRKQIEKKLGDETLEKKEKKQLQKTLKKDDKTKKT